MKEIMTKYFSHGVHMLVKDGGVFRSSIYSITIKIRHIFGYWENRIEEVFPLVLRPLGSLWLYGPREPMAHFDSRNMKGIETLCFSSTYSHKEEIFIESKYGNVNCSEINSIYPYVNRQCTSRGCNETLQLVNGSVLQKFTYDYVYRTISYVETNRSYKAC
jgi:hypothetical protein